MWKSFQKKKKTSLHYDLDLVAVKYPDELMDYAEDFT
jgi:hypothetical protein